MTIAEERIHTTIIQDTLSFSDLFNVKWPEVGAHFCTNGKIAYERKVTNHEVNSIFEKIFPNGVDSEILSVLDRGYKIAFSDNRMSVKFMWIEKYDQATAKKVDSIFVRAVGLYSAMEIGFKIYHETWEKDKAYVYEDWFGSSKPYPCHILGSEWETILDCAVDNHGTNVVLSKTSDDRYELIFEKQRCELTAEALKKRAQLPPGTFCPSNEDQLYYKDQVKVLFKKLVVC